MIKTEVAEEEGNQKKNGNRSVKRKYSYELRKRIFL